MLKYQRGFSLNGLMFWGGITAVIAILWMTVIPPYVENFKLQKCIKSSISKMGPTGTVLEFKEHYNRYAIVDHLDITAEQLVLGRTGSEFVAKYDYERRVPLFGNMSVVIHFEGSSSDKNSFFDFFKLK